MLTGTLAITAVVAVIEHYTRNSFGHWIFSIAGHLGDTDAAHVLESRAGHVRVRSGEHAGREGQWAGLAGMRRFSGGTFLEAGWVAFGGESPQPVPLADLERFV